MLDILDIINKRELQIKEITREIEILLTESPELNSKKILKLSEELKELSFANAADSSKLTKYNLN